MSKRLWIAYNHVPGGNIVAMHFDEVVREQRVGQDITKKVVFLPEEQLRGFENSDFVAVNVKGKITRNKTLVYSGPEIDLRDPKAGDRVIKWAEEQGMEPIAPPKKKQELDEARKLSERLDSHEARLDRQDEKLGQILAAVKK